MPQAYKAITMYTAFDGTCHSTSQAALKHVQNAVGEDLDEQLKGLIASRKQTMDVILHMMKKPELFIEILSRLTKYEESEDENENE